jgi:GNAT-family acetyltransferase (TIGR03103 family)
MSADVVQELGWGRLVFGNTFGDHDHLGALLSDDATGRRDCCLYLPDPHVFVAQHPQDFFIDPSLVYRVDLIDREPASTVSEQLVKIRPARDRSELEAMNRLYSRCRMVTANVDDMETNLRQAPHVLQLVAVDTSTGDIIGTAIGVDHHGLYGDPTRGSSLWCLAIDPTTVYPGVGLALVETLIADFTRRGLAYMDLSVMHDNKGAIKLYERLGFRKIPEFVIKRKNAINEKLFAPQPGNELDALNPYARIIADEALLRGIRVEVLDAGSGYLQLQYSGRTVITRESLSQYTSAIAMSRCDDKRVARRIAEEAGIRVPRARVATFDEADHEFMREVGEVVVKPVRGEQGAGITVRVNTDEQLEEARRRAGGQGTEVLIEEFVEGEDVRLIVIDGRVVAAAVRRPPEIIATGEHTIRRLIEAQSRRRAAATGGESTIPVDDVTELALREEGWELDDTPPAGTKLVVRRTANLHTGGTIHDITSKVSPQVVEAAISTAKAIGIPVTGIDFLMPDVAGDDYVFIEANERPGLANHEPQPVVEAFIDYLFPMTARNHFGQHQSDDHRMTGSGRGR